MQQPQVSEWSCPILRLFLCMQLLVIMEMLVLREQPLDHVLLDILKLIIQLLHISQEIIFFAIYRHQHQRLRQHQLPHLPVLLH